MSSVQFSHSVVSDSVTPGLQHARPPCPSPTPRAAQTQVHQVSDAIQPSHPLSSPSPPFNLSSIRVFPNEPVLPIRWPKYWSFSISPSNEYSGLISFKTDWFDLLGRKAMTKLDSILKSRFYFADKCLSSQSYGFSSNHV